MRRPAFALRATTVALLAALLLSAGRAEAAARDGEGATDVPEERGSIYRLNLALDIPIVAVGAIGTAVPFLMSSTVVDRRCPCDPGHVNSLDHLAIGNHSSTASVIGDVTVGLAVAAPVALELLTVRPMPTLFEDLGVFAEVMAVNGGLVTLAKFTVQRPTPQTYAGDPERVHSPGGYLSFYSGHTSFTFASLSFAAVTLSVRNRQVVWPWIVTGVTGGGVAAAMVLAGAHFPTDVAMGALAGTAVGVTIPLLHLRSSQRLGLDLVPSPAGRGLALQGRF
jgi:hypothetical protein